MSTQEDRVGQPNPLTGPPLTEGHPPMGPVPSNRGSLWSRPWFLVLVVGVAIALSVVVMGVMIMISLRTTTPDRQVFAQDFATSGDTSLTVEEGLSWDSQGGTLNLYLTDESWQELHFDIPTSPAAKVVATLTQPAYADTSVELVWGVVLLSEATDQGVGLLCSPGEPPGLIDIASGEFLGFGGGGGTCEETMEMTLEVSGTRVTIETDTGCSLLYIGDIDYSQIDTVAVGIGSSKPDQVLRVSKIASYVP